MNLVIRHATIRDASNLASFNLAFARETKGLTLNRRVVGLGIRTLLANPAHGFYVVADDGKKIVGMAMITYEWSDWSNQQWWWVQKGYVSPDFRRQGIFSRLYHYVSEVAAQSGKVCGIRLNAEKGNRPASRTCRMLGMEKSPDRIYQEPLLAPKKKPAAKISKTRNRSTKLRT